MGSLHDQPKSILSHPAPPVTSSHMSLVETSVTMGEHTEGAFKQIFDHHHAHHQAQMKAMMAGTDEVWEAEAPAPPVE